MRRVRSVGLWLLVATSLGTAGAAYAHHSFAMFDMKKTVELAGTVKEFQWTNPHTWIQLVVDSPDAGGPQEWGIEMTSPSGLIREGWHPNSLSAGDKVTVAIHPLSSGALGGSEVKVTRADGTVVGTPR